LRRQTLPGNFDVFNMGGRKNRHVAKIHRLAAVGKDFVIS
jgi:hypothetical protein